MKPPTTKKPIQPKIDCAQGQNLFAKLIEKILSSNSPLVEKVKSGQHADSKRCQTSGSYIRKKRAKRKRKRKISYQSRRDNRLYNFKKIRIQTYKG